jgi:hypothetical protein
MFDGFITGAGIGPYNNYGVKPYVPYKVKNITIGPNGLNDTTQGLDYKYWAAYFDGNTNNLIIEDLELSNTVTILNEPLGIDNIALAFDQNANDTYAYIDGSGDLKIRFFDAIIPGDTIINIGPAQSVTMTMDMKYYPSSASSDILLFYIRSGAIYYRLQRDKYATEYATPVIAGGSRLHDSGMRTDYRFQVRWS